MVASSMHHGRGRRGPPSAEKVGRRGQGQIDRPLSATKSFRVGGEEAPVIAAILAEIEQLDRDRAALMERLRAALAGNLATVPVCVPDATADYFEEQDLFGHWLSASCEAQQGNDRITEITAKLFGSWKAYALQAGEKPGSHKGFSMELKKRKLRQGRLGAARFFQSIRLRLIESDAPGDT
jgi:hypothetical protein